MVPFYQLKMLRTFAAQSGENLLPPRGSSLVRTLLLIIKNYIYGKEDK